MTDFILILTTWIMQSHPGLYEQLEKTTSYLLNTSNRTRLGFIATHPNGEWLDKVFLPVYLAYTSAYNKWKDIGQRTIDAILNLEDSEREIKPLYRTLRGILTAVPYVSEADLRLMGMPGRHLDPKRPAPVATVFPVITVATLLVRHLLFSFFTLDPENRPRKHKPDGQHGVELCWIISAVPVVNIEQLLHSAFTTTTDLDLAFTGEDRGKIVYFAARWENTRGEKGPWSPIESAMIP